MCVCVCVLVCLCLSLTSESSESNEVIITWRDDCLRHEDVSRVDHLDLDHTDRNRENNKCSIISETLLAMRIKFAVKIVD